MNLNVLVYDNNIFENKLVLYLHSTICNMETILYDPKKMSDLHSMHVVIFSVDLS